MDFLICVCLSTSMNSKPLLPITIEMNIPHDSLPIGLSDLVVKLYLPVTFDTVAVVCVGSYNYHLAVTKIYPKVVKSLVWAKDQYIALTLSGVVAEEAKSTNKKKIATMLKAVIEYHMPLKTKQGHVTLLKVALGDGVGVNTIMGMSMICPAKLNLDVVDDVVTSRILDCAPFPVTYKSVQKSMPNFNNNEGESTVLTSVNNKSQMINLIKLCIKEAFTVDNKEAVTDDLNPATSAAEQEERE